MASIQEYIFQRYQRKKESRHRKHKRNVKNCSGKFSLATVAVTFVVRRKVDPDYGKKTNV